MKMNYYLLSSLIFVFFSCSKNQPNTTLGQATNKEIIDQLTLLEKAYLVTGAQKTKGGQKDSTIVIGAPVAAQLNNLVSGAAGMTYSISEYGITSMVLADGPAGVRIHPIRKDDSLTYYCTAFPVASLLASTWNVDIVQRVGDAIGEEALEYGVDIMLCPGMNLHRNPLCGRNFEYYSEDPLLSGKMAASMVNGIQSKGVGASIKHFVANNTETNRRTLNTIMSERTLRELYLKSFRIAIKESQPWAVMSSYNLVNGQYASESYDLLTKILREDWGFKGVVMTDWWGGVNTKAQVIAGNDLLMPGLLSQSDSIISGVQNGNLSEESLNTNVDRILSLVQKTPRFKKYSYTNSPDLNQHALLVRKAASEGMVLLKNKDATLPLPKRKITVAPFGIATYESKIGGTGSGDVNEKYSISILNGLIDLEYKIPNNLIDTYTSYIHQEEEKKPLRKWYEPEIPTLEMPISYSLIHKMASSADYALITIGRNSGEFEDRSIEGDFNLNSTEQKLIKEVSDAFHAQNKKVIILLNVGGVIETDSWKKNADAIVLVSQGGQETGHAVGDILSGKVNPSAKLPTTFPINYQDTPSAKNFPGKVISTEGQQSYSAAEAFKHPQDAEIKYEEGIFIGYRYFSTFDQPTSYEFGYGLSYTTFSYSGMHISPLMNDSITVSIDIKNIGKVAGKEVVQLYIKAPAKTMNKPKLELKAFAKTKLLPVGGVQKVKMKLHVDDLSSYDESRSSWVVEEGLYQLIIGASSKDIKATLPFTIEEEMITGTKALVPKQII